MALSQKSSKAIIFIIDNVDNVDLMIFINR